MSKLQLFALNKLGYQSLAVPPNIHNIDDLYQGLALGIYSVFRTFEHNKFLKLEEHLKRTERSLALIGLHEKVDWVSFCQCLHQVCTASHFPEMRVRYDVLAEPAYSLGTSSRILIALMPLKVPTPQQYQTGVRVGLAPGLSRQQPLAKTANFTRQRRATWPGKNKVKDYLILDKEGYILEGTSSNFYGIREGTVWTAGTGVLEGITRQIILDLLPKLNISSTLKSIHLDEINTLTEAAISSSSRGFLPVVKIGEQTVGRGTPGGISSQIMAAYHEYVAQNIRTAIDVLPKVIN